MYKLVKDGTTIAMVEVPTYIKMQENACFALCEAEEAQGLAHAGTVYHLLGRRPLDGAKTIMLVEVDAGKVIQNAHSAIDDLVVESLNAETTIRDIQSTIDNLLVASLEGSVKNV